MFFRRLLDHVRGSLRPSQPIRNRRSAQLFLEELESRIVPTVLYFPQNGAETAVYHNGGVISNPHMMPIYTIFWGTYWATTAGQSLASGIENSLNPIFNDSTFLDTLAEYGVDYPAGVSGSGTVEVFDDSSAARNPASSFTGTALANEAAYGIQSLGLPAPNANPQIGIYFVFTPPFDTQSGSNAAAYHTYGTESGQQFLYGWIGTNGTLAYADYLLSQEVEETMTDPYGTGWQVNPFSASAPNEICDNEALNYTLYLSDAYEVQSHWSNYFGEYEIDDGTSADWYVSNGVLGVYGDQTATNDTISVSTNSIDGGVYVTMNGESVSFPYTQITSINIYPETGTNTVNVYKTNVPVTIQSGGKDNVNIGNTSDGLQDINGAVSVTNPPNFTNLTINDTNDSVSHTAYLYNDELMGLSPQPIYWNNADVSAVSIYGGYGGNTFWVENTVSNGDGAYTYLNAGSNSSFNSVNVLATTGLIDVDGSTSGQYVYIDSLGSTFSGTLANIHGTVDVYNSSGSGYSELFVDDAADTGNHTDEAMYDGEITGLAPAAIYWGDNDPGSLDGGVDYLLVENSTGSNTIWVYGTSPLYNGTYLDGTGEGTTTVNVESTSASHGKNLYVNSYGGQQDVYIGSNGSNLGGTLANIDGSVDVYNASSTSGYSQLYLDDSADTGSHTEILSDGQLVGLAPATIYWADNTSGHPYGGVNFLDIFGSTGSNTITIASTGSLYYDTWLNGTGGGSSSVVVENTAANGPGGDDNLYVNGGNGGQTVTIGDSGSLAGILGSVYVYNSGSGFTYLSVDDSSDNTVRSAKLFDGEITGLSPASIIWEDGSSSSDSGGVESVVVDGGTVASTYTVESTGNFYFYTHLNTGNGNNTVKVYATTGGLYVDEGSGVNSVSVGTSGKILDDIQGFVNVYGGTGNSLVLNDGSNPDTDTYTVTSSYVTRNSIADIDYSGQATLKLYGSTAGTYDIDSSASGTAGTITAGSGNDAFFVGPFSESFANIAGSLSLNGGSSTNTLVIDDQDDTSSDSVTVNSGSISQSLGATVSSSSIDTVTINGSSVAADTFSVSSTAAATPVTINAGAAANTINVTSSSKNLNNILGLLTVTGGNNSTLNVKDEDAPAAETYTVTSSAVTRSGMAGVDYSTVALDLYGGADGNTVKVVSTASHVTVNAGTGTNTVAVGNSNKLDNIQGSLNVNGGSSTSKLNIDDQSNTSAQTYTLSASTLARTGVATITYSDLESVAVNGSSGGNTFVVTATPSIKGTFNGGTGTNSLTGPNATNKWIIKGSNTGSLNSTVYFNAVAALTGNAGNDTFEFSGATASVSGSVNGGGGTDKLDYAENGGGAIAVNLQTAKATGIGGTFSNITELEGSTATTNTLTGVNISTVFNVWTISSADGGKVDYNSPEQTLSFTNIDNLVGGTGVDVFKFSGSGSVVSIAGGGAPTNQGDWLDYSAITSSVIVNLATGAATSVSGSVSNIQDVCAGSGGSSLTGNSSGNLLVGGAAADTITGGSGRSVLIGNAGADTINGNSGADLLIGGTSTYATDSTSHILALMSILAEWQSGPLTSSGYNARLTALINGGGLNGTNKLTAGVTVSADLPSANSLTGGNSGAGPYDWFFYDSSDTLNGVESGETETLE